MGSERFPRLIVLCVASLTIASGCSHDRVADFRPEPENDEKAAIFGSFRITWNGKEATEEAVLFFSNGERLVLDREGFVALHCNPGRLSLKKITLRSNGADYAITNMAFRSGPPGSRTYFGHVTFAIQTPRPGSVDMTENWGWQATNRWTEDSSLWSSHFGATKQRTFSSLAEKTGADSVQTRSIATDRNAVEFGL